MTADLIQLLRHGHPDQKLRREPRRARRDVHHEPRRRANPALRDRRTGQVQQLLDRRPELRGVHAFADEVAEYVSWTV